MVSQHRAHLEQRFCFSKPEQDSLLLVSFYYYDHGSYSLSWRWIQFRLCSAPISSCDFTLIIILHHFPFQSESIPAVPALPWPWRNPVAALPAPAPSSTPKQAKAFSLFPPRAQACPELAFSPAPSLRLLASQRMGGTAISARAVIG